MLVFVLQLLYHEVLLHLTLHVGSCLDGDSTHVDEFQDTSRHEVVIIGAKVSVGIQNVIGLLQVTIQGDVAIPQQVFIDPATRTIHTDQSPEEGDNRTQCQGNVDEAE